MELKYPIFILSKDDLTIRMINSPKELDWYEEIDIKEGLYNGWDINGYPIELYMDGKKVALKFTSLQSSPTELKEAILNYARIMKPNSPFINSAQNTDVLGLFKAVEKHVNIR